MASSQSICSEKKELDRLHRLLMTDIANCLDQISTECDNLFYHIKGIVGQGLFSEKKSVLDKLSTLETRGIIQPGKNYEMLIQIFEDSGNISTRDMIIRHVQEMDEFRKQIHEKGKNRSDPIQSPGTESNSDDSLPCTEQNQVIEQQMKNISHTQSVKKRKSSGNASQGSHQKRKLTHDSPEPEFQPRPSTSKSDFSREDAIQNAYSEDADPPKKRKYTREFEITDAPPTPRTSKFDFGPNRGVENACPASCDGVKNYLYAMILLQQAHDVLVPFCGEIIKHQHQTLLQTVQQEHNIAIMTCSVCEIQTLSPYHVRTAKNYCPLGYHRCNCLKSKETYECPTKVCGTMYDEIIKLHIKRSPSMMNLDISKLYEDPWEIAKCFIPYSCNLDSLQDTDLSGILYIIINNKSFNDRVTTMDLFNELRVLRNNLMHSSSMLLGDSEFAFYENCVMNLLNIPELKNRPETHKALKSYEEVSIKLLFL
ncbi:uncharacterized protein LOC132721728, partial [Ruditapes philippinarum]|uniref:uncharacterized protein LOC132721728 n=1 Tax=Ruditapes philippinarum TaxID=129788 RepID=UPI00295B3F62